MVAKFPSVKSYSGLANAYYKNKQFEDALDYYKKSLVIEPENSNSKKMILTIENR